MSIGQEAVGLGALKLSAPAQTCAALAHAPLIRIGEFGISGSCTSAYQAGGDFYDVIPLSSGSPSPSPGGEGWGLSRQSFRATADEGGSAALLAVVDVMGKGELAAVFAGAVRAVLRSLLEFSNDPAELLTHLNELMYPELNEADVFATAQVALLDARNRTLQVAGAGHCPLLLACDGQEPRGIMSQQMPLGIAPDLVFVREEVSLPPGACALLYTDGIPESCNPLGEFFSQARLESWVRRASRASATATALNRSLLAEIRSFQGGLPPRDDQALLLIVDELGRAPSAARAIENFPAALCC